LGLKTALLEQDLGVYDQKTFEVSKYGLTANLEKVEVKYGCELRSLLEAMLSINPVDRPNYLQISEAIHNELYQLDHPDVRSH